jgi:hypothetical protein
VGLIREDYIVRVVYALLKKAGARFIRKLEAKRKTIHGKVTAPLVLQHAARR